MVETHTKTNIKHLELVATLVYKKTAIKEMRDNPAYFLGFASLYCRIGLDIALTQSLEGNF